MVATIAGLCSVIGVAAHAWGQKRAGGELDAADVKRDPQFQAGRKAGLPIAITAAILCVTFIVRGCS